MLRRRVSRDSEPSKDSQHRDQLDLKQQPATADIGLERVARRPAGFAEFSKDSIGIAS